MSCTYYFLITHLKLQLCDLLSHPWIGLSLDLLLPCLKYCSSLPPGKVHLKCHLVCNVSPNPLRESLSFCCHRFLKHILYTSRRILMTLMYTFYVICFPQLDCRLLKGQTRSYLSLIPSLEAKFALHETGPRYVHVFWMKKWGPQNLSILSNFIKWIMTELGEEHRSFDFQLISCSSPMWKVYFFPIINLIICRKIE